MNLPGDDGGRLTGPKSAFESGEAGSPGEEHAARSAGFVGQVAGQLYDKVPNRVKDAIAMFRGKGKATGSVSHPQPA